VKLSEEPMDVAAGVWKEKTLCLSWYDGVEAEPVYPKVRGEAYVCASAGAREHASACMCACFYFVS
jgi:hypothetical protein